MPFDHAEFTRDVRELVAQVPEQRRNPDNQPIEPAGTVIEVEGGAEFVSNGFVWLACIPGGDATTYRGFTPAHMNRFMWWVVSGDRGRVEG